VDVNHPGNSEFTSKVHRVYGDGAGTVDNLFI